MGKNCVHRVLSLMLVMSGLSVAAVSQPTVERISDTPAACFKQAFEVRWEVRWHGAPDAYTILPPEFDDVEWAAVTPGPVEALVRDGVNVVQQSVLVTPNQLGSFEVPEIRVGYLTPGDLNSAKQPEEVSGTQEPEKQIPRLRLAGFTVEVRRDLTVLWAALAIGAAGLLLYLGGMGVLLLRRRREARSGAAAADRATESAEGRLADPRAAGVALHEAKRCRVDGDPYAFYLRLAKAAELLGSEQDELAGVLQARAQKIGFQGFEPTEDEMETDYRAVARALKLLIHEDEAPAS
ncbi:MAG TPA: hypothetical protein PKM22_11485 [Candidatus Hydrogenedentes bacterium]|nr:hypothetical protein [FCB group bacterium]HNV22268.1 hypothetical protein [Candidatus Hydrogenedentota bacterium]HPV39040.1 hypothetical protein [Candidatus Hydrogenedentota bacterium]HQE77288.1 hypothetical protein [Candidatus Hydrogenedentota bacterium]